jgi:hypothetical protein
VNPSATAAATSKYACLVIERGPSCTDGGQVRVPQHLDHGPAAPLEMLRDLAQLDQASLSYGVDDRDGVADQVGVAVLVQPVQP